MAYYHTCQLCGANLDPGERCDCMKNARPANESNRAARPHKWGSNKGQPHYSTGEPSIQEGGSTMSKDNPPILTIVGIVGAVFIVILAFGYLSGHFVSALVCIGAIAFLGIMAYLAIC